eukprot:TRINITY_DN23924_c0_g1_i1.p1 TRINITY_DN23924_c0_g1~~TRINITY_DN23924_c0_g1_i1.p1  ORF type:complete len:282 (-),score=36.04 TRINITY_DN23924_c0_g1_i1:750-1595(-)
MRDRKKTFNAAYTLGSSLGRGEFGEVFLTKRNGRQKDLAVKRISLEACTAEEQEYVLESAENEAMIASRLADHPHCVKLLDFMHDDKFCYLVMELCASTLMQAMYANASSIRDDMVSLLRQMLSAVAHCHDRGILHCDIKPHNFLFGGPDGATLKLCDFGLAQALPEEGYCIGMRGTAPYMAPEVVSCEKYNEKIDVWSVGVVAYLILFQCFPYSPKEKDCRAMKSMIRSGTPTPTFTSDERGTFIRKLMKRCKERRCSAQTALTSAFLAMESAQSDHSKS